MSAPTDLRAPDPSRPARGGAKKAVADDVYVCPTCGQRMPGYVARGAA